MGLDRTLHNILSEDKRKIEQLELKVERLTQALLDHGVHKSRCACRRNVKNPRCNCGWRDLLKELSGE